MLRYGNIGCSLSYSVVYRKQISIALYDSGNGLISVQYLWCGQICGECAVEKKGQTKGDKTSDFKLSGLHCNFGKALSVILFHSIQADYTNFLCVPLLKDLKMFSRCFFSCITFCSQFTLTFLPLL